MIFDIDLNQFLWREYLRNNGDYVAFCATAITAAAIQDSQSESSQALPDRMAFNSAIIKNAENFAPLYARITTSTIEDVEAHYSSRESFFAYTQANWGLFFEMGKEIVLA